MALQAKRHDGRRHVRRPSVLCVATALMLAIPHVPQAAGADAAPVELSVQETDGRYTVAARFAVPGSTEASIAVLTDYERIPAFMPGVKTSFVRERSAGRAVIEQDAVSRFLFFSKRVHLVLEVRQEGGTIRFRDLSGESFTHYEGGWRVSDVDGNTLVPYELSATPAFAVPASVLRRLLKRDSAAMVAQLRREIARRAAGPQPRYTAPRPQCSPQSSSSMTSN